MGTGAPGDIPLTEAGEDTHRLYWFTLVLCILDFMFCAWNFYREAREVYASGPINHLAYGWNVFDFLLISLETFYVSLVFDTMLHNHVYESSPLYHSGMTDKLLMHIRTIGAVTIFFKWMKGFYWGKIFQKPAYFIVQLYETVLAVIGFFAMFLLCVLAFTNFYMVI